MICLDKIFLAQLYESTESYCCHFDQHGRWCLTLKIYIKDFYVMGKALSDKLPCTGTGLVLNFVELKVFGTLWVEIFP